VGGIRDIESLEFREDSLVRVTLPPEEVNHGTYLEGYSRIVFLMGLSPISKDFDFDVAVVYIQRQRPASWYIFGSHRTLVRSGGNRRKDLPHPLYSRQTCDLNVHSRFPDKR
jgi:hypothetical protein